MKRREGETAIRYNIVFTTFSCRKLFTESAISRLEEVLNESCRAMKVDPLGIKVLPDRAIVDVVVSDVRTAVNSLVVKFKADSCQIINREFPEIRAKVPTIWTSGYYIASVGVPLSDDEITEYVKSQKQGKKKGEAKKMTQKIIKSNDGRPIRMCFTAEKGGVGKTFLSVNVAANLALQGVKVLIVVADAQDDLSNEYLKEGATPPYLKQEHRNLYEALLGEYSLKDAIYKTRPLTARAIKGKKNTFTLDILPAGRLVDRIQVPIFKMDEDGNPICDEDGNEIYDFELFDQIFTELEKLYEVIIFDMPPDRHDLTRMLVSYCQYVIVPVEGRSSEDSYEYTEEYINYMNVQCGRDITLLGAVQNRCHSRRKSAKLLYDLFKTKKGDDKIFNAVIPEDAAKENYRGYPLCAVPKSRAEDALWNLTNEIIEKINKYEELKEVR